MKKILLIITFLWLSTLNGFAQSHEIGGMLGVAGYGGELGTTLHFAQYRPAFTLFYRYNVNDYLSLRPSFTYARLYGSDARAHNYSSGQIHKRLRNLSFFSNVYEVSVSGELYFVNRFKHKFAPYLLGGVGVFHFNPKTHTVDGQTVRLQPLGTEGQGIEGYGEKYSLVAFNATLGAGFSSRITDKLRWGMEAGLRLTSTRYLDDVSGNYVDKGVLEANNGVLSAQLSDRSAEVQATGDRHMVEFVDAVGGFEQDEYGYLNAPGHGREGDKRGTGRRDRYLLILFTLSYSL
ncbi:MAG: DUF6089 family protein [Cytophagaceae bacterium]